MSNLAFWKPIVGEGWYLNNQELFDSQDMMNLMGFLVNEYKIGKIAPLQGDIFKAFKLTPYNKVKVIIVGQDPYPTFTNGIPDATGLAFANRRTVLGMSPSLKQINLALEKDIFRGGPILDFDVTLESWAEQGVLMLNTALTINTFRKSLHKPYWKFFIESLLLNLSNNKTGLHFVFWGKDAQKFNTMNGLFHYTYEYKHPASVVYNPGTSWDCKHFTEINMNLLGQNGESETIKWCNIEPTQNQTVKVSNTCTQE